MHPFGVHYRSRFIFILVPHTLRVCSNGHPYGVPIWAPYGCPLQVAIIFLFSFRTFGALMGTKGPHMCTLQVHIKSACVRVKNVTLRVLILAFLVAVF